MTGAKYSHIHMYMVLQFSKPFHLKVSTRVMRHNFGKIQNVKGKSDGRVVYKFLGVKIR